MIWLNDGRGWGLGQRILHWLTLPLVVGLLLLGWWMTGLDYYHPWYHRAPWWHKSVGVLVFLLLGLRLLLRALGRAPPPLDSHARWQRSLARLTHWLLYLLLLLVPVTGFLMATADGRGLSVFGWFELPALGIAMERQADIAGQAHWLLAMTLLALASLHALAALKHHFIDRDRTIWRMIRHSRKGGD